MRLLIACLLIAGTCHPAAGQGKIKAAREIAESLLGRFGAKVGDVGQLTTRIERLAAKHGDEAIEALRKSGPAGVELVEAAGVNGGKALRALATHGVQAETRILSRPTAMRQFLQHGDDAGLALVRHPGVAEPLIEKGGSQAVKALTAIDPQNGRRLAMLAEGELAKHPEVFSVASKHGDKAVKFMWENRVALAGTAVAAAFVLNPEPYMDGTKGLIEATGGAVIKPVAESVVKPVVQETSHILTVALCAIGAVLIIGVFLACRYGLVVKNGGASRESS